MMEDYEDDLERLAAAGLCGGRRSSTVRNYNKYKDKYNKCGGKRSSTVSIF